MIQEQHSLKKTNTNVKYKQKRLLLTSEATQLSSYIQQHSKLLACRSQDLLRCAFLHLPRAAQAFHYNENGSRVRFLIAELLSEPPQTQGLLFSSPDIPTAPKILLTHRAAQQQRSCHRNEFAFHPKCEQIQLGAGTAGSACINSGPCTAEQKLKPRTSAAWSTQRVDRSSAVTSHGKVLLPQPLSQGVTEQIFSPSGFNKSMLGYEFKSSP